MKLVYYGTGNPGLWSPSYRCGKTSQEECNNGEHDNKWSMTLFARKIGTALPTCSIVATACCYARLSGSISALRVMR
ncbi:TPA: hypothetical protein HH295_10100 [Xanthomonas vasicola pv. zeae]|uniref:hypothetical protein n=1 Tax=Xanthomonas vasicola TaxID=56459 RepID=UPI000345EAA0|nr:hypothetical protein [Xanthomonas vasicola]HHZ22859.1 hypothetical protein [Xanthomonas vasicola pv. zeae]HHZ26902.1 hypothetical protein [Xanthomonas vasicola pv. zeae]HHZ31033.1 hypothetical protein [Xanthomonas vasicola pv. zeae]HHZ34458.1 hypothetical protein [Xanthomonas vasicola pv. zeae]HHZ40458.1 hypothetical protein [Xanthomonas vasicola pv. zeae]